MLVVGKYTERQLNRCCHSHSIRGQYLGEVDSFDCIYFETLKEANYWIWYNTNFPNGHPVKIKGE